MMHSLILLLTTLAAAAASAPGSPVTAPLLTGSHWDDMATFCFIESGVTFKDQSQPPVTKPPADCMELKSSGQHFSGIYMIYRCVMKMPVAIPVYCDMTTDGGGWTVIQRRTDGSQFFVRIWNDYKDGFGDLEQEFWLGNDFISLLTASSPQELRVDLEDFDGSTAYAKYSSFSVAPAFEKYELTVTGYSGTAGDAFTYQSGAKFSTVDQDNDDHSTHCAQVYPGAWWYKDCINSNLNGGYFPDGVPSKDRAGIYWRQWKGSKVSLKGSSMMIRPRVAILS